MAAAPPTTRRRQPRSETRGDFPNSKGSTDYPNKFSPYVVLAGLIDGGADSMARSVACGGPTALDPASAAALAAVPDAQKCVAYARLKANAALEQQQRLDRRRIKEDDQNEAYRAMSPIEQAEWHFGKCRQFTASWRKWFQTFSDEMRLDPAVDDKKLCKTSALMYNMVRPGAYSQIAPVIPSQIHTPNKKSALYHLYRAYQLTMEAALVPKPPLVFENGNYALNQARLADDDAWHRLFGTWRPTENRLGHGAAARAVFDANPPRDFVRRMESNTVPLYGSVSPQEAAVTLGRHLYAQQARAPGDPDNNIYAHMPQTSEQWTDAAHAMVNLYTHFPIDETRIAAIPDANKPDTDANAIRNPPSCDGVVPTPDATHAFYPSGRKVAVADRYFQMSDPSPVIGAPDPNNPMVWDARVAALMLKSQVEQGRSLAKQLQEHVAYQEETTRTKAEERAGIPALWPKGPVDRGNVPGVVYETAEGTRRMGRATQASPAAYVDASSVREVLQTRTNFINFAPIGATPEPVQYDTGNLGFVSGTQRYTTIPLGNSIPLLLHALFLLNAPKETPAAQVHGWFPTRTNGMFQRGTATSEQEFKSPLSRGWDTMSAQRAPSSERAVTANLTGPLFLDRQFGELNHQPPYPLDLTIPTVVKAWVLRYIDDTDAYGGLRIFGVQRAAP